MRCLHLIPALFIALQLMSPAVSFAEQTALGQLLNELRLGAAETRSLSSNLLQEKNLAIFSAKLTSHGRFLYQAPDHLRWELIEPVASGFVLRGSAGERWSSLSQERETFSVETDPIMGLIARQLLAWARVDLDWLQSRYRMELTADQSARLRLVPLEQTEAAFIDYLQVQFSADRRHIAEVLMVEQGGDSTLLRFTDVQLNEELTSASFQAPEFR